jgi:hypothetical protein
VKGKQREVTNNLSGVELFPITVVCRGRLWGAIWIIVNFHGLIVSRRTMLESNQGAGKAQNLLIPHDFKFGRKTVDLLIR